MNRIETDAAWLAERSRAAAFVAALGDVRSDSPIDVHAYCLLPRHFHLVLRSERAAVDAAITRLESLTGFPRGAPYRVVPVAFGRHLMEVSRYVHLNPVHAGLVWRPEDWPFSSFRGYLGDPAAPRWLSTQAVLGKFGGAGARHRYRAYVYAGMDPGTRDADGRPRWSTLYGEGSLAEDLAWRVEPALTLRPIPRPRGPRMILGTLAREIAAVFDVPTAALRSTRRGGARAAVARGALVHAARAHGSWRLSDVAAWLGYASPGAAASAAERFDRALRAHPGLAARLEDALRRALSGVTAASGSSSGT